MVTDFENKDQITIIRALPNIPNAIFISGPGDSSKALSNS